MLALQCSNLLFASIRSFDRKFYFDLAAIFLRFGGNDIWFGFNSLQLSIINRDIRYLYFFFLGKKVNEDDDKKKSDFASIKEQINCYNLQYHIGHFDFYSSGLEPLITGS